MIAGLGYLLIGTLLSWIGWRHWRYREQEAISVLEAAILRGDEPLARTGLDRLLTYAQAVLGLVLGPFFFIVGVFVILVELELI